MKVEKVEVGYLRCNCYILSKDNKLLVIDPGDEFNKIDSVINGREVVGIIITHHHFDHVGAVNDIVNKYHTKVYDKHNLSEGNQNIANFNFCVINTPGHKDDLITIYFASVKIMFGGDFIFKDGLGRCDLSGGNIIDMRNSLAKIKKYDQDILIYPGHGDITYIKDIVEDI